MLDNSSGLIASDENGLVFTVALSTIGRGRMIADYGSSYGILNASKPHNG